MTDAVQELVRHFETIHREHMRGLPIVNPRLQVEAIGFREFAGQQLGVLITPWFMNLVLLPGGAAADVSPQGTTSSVDFPSGAMEFTSCLDDVLGNFRTAVLFRTVSDLPDQDTAREIARQIMRDLFVDTRRQRSMSRRALLTGRRVS